MLYNVTLFRRESIITRNNLVKEMHVNKCSLVHLEVSKAVEIIKHLFIPHVHRDLGSSLDRLSVLWMARCGLEDIDGVASMTHLTELYLAYNEIDDVSPCSMLENLTILDLEG